MKKHLSLFFLLPLCLASCSKQTVSGKYSFLLGREGESKIGVSMTLEERDFLYQKNIEMKDNFIFEDEILTYDKSQLRGGEYFMVLFDGNHGNSVYYYKYNKETNKIEPFGPNPPSPILGKNGQIFHLEIAFGDAEQQLPEILQSILKQGITGYYSLAKQEHDYGRRVNIGFVTRKEFIPGLEVIYSIIKDDLGEEAAEIVESFIEGSDSQISPELIQKFVVAYQKDKNLTIQLPVSFEDLQLQLAWYGTYIDISPEVKMKIHSIQDVYSNLLDILMGLRYFNLFEHTEKFLRPGESDYRVIPLPGGETIQGEDRIGTHPGMRFTGKKQTQDERDTLEIADIAQMNYLYSNEFSNTLVYTGAGFDTIGAITRAEPQGFGSTSPNYQYYYYDRSGKIDDSSKTVRGYVGVANEYGIYNEYEEVDIELGANNLKDYELGYVINSVKKVVDGSELSFDSFYQKPFTFRDPHDIRLTLTKE